ncbi:uncharacterized protein LOC123872073 [Maniola jurtina]|uniref:uncharacterized protein LOC123872073 n=1 Tax=Maniola jurtina TaxID=191418 RepID=UPI001E68C2AE|nr:uncharacterized protein LOC123872073 [Maniola jurtina]
MEKAGLVAFFLFLRVVSSEIAIEANLAAEIIRSLEKLSSVIVAVTCWSSYEKVQLYSVLAGKNVSQQNVVEFVDPGDMPQNLNDKQHLMFLADLSCPDALNSLQMYSEEKMFAAPFRWILIGLNAIDSEKNVLKNVDFLVDSQVLILQQLNNLSYELYYVYKIGPERSLKKELFGVWSKSHGFQKSKNLSKITALRRINLESYEIKICYVLTDNDSINHLTDEVNDHIDTITKVNFPTTNQLLDFLNAGRKYLYTETWGYRRNNSWNGMTGYLVREEVEIGGSPMFLTFERLSVVEYISSPTPTRSKFVFQQPKLSYENNLFLLSFKVSLWVGSGVLLLLIYLVLCIVAFWEWRRTRRCNSRIEDAGILRPNVIDVGLFVFGTACQQGSTVELKGSLGRMVLIFLFVTVTFLYTSYAANIVALLQSSSSQIRTLDDLLHSRIKFGVHDTVYNRYYFSTETEPVRRAIYETKVAPPGTTPRFMSMERGVQEIKKGLFAFHMETGVGYKFVGKYFEEGEKCGLKEIQYLRVIDPWLAVRKNTPFMEMFKIGTKRLQEHGLQQRENHLLYEKRPKCSGRQANFVSVSMVDCYPAFLVLSYGALIALIIALLEIIHYRRYQIEDMMLNRGAMRRHTKKMELVTKLADVRSPKSIQFVQNIENLENAAETKDLMIIADLNCSTTKSFINKANATRKFRKPYRWLCIDKNPGKNNIPTDLDDLNILLDSEVILAQKEGSHFVMNLVYKLKPKSYDWKLESFGTWMSTGLNISKNMGTPITIRRKNLEGMPIGISVVVTSEDTQKDALTFNLKLNVLHVDFVSKSSIRQVNPLFDFMNATRVLVFTETWGYAVNGTYNGMIGDLLKGDAELAGTVIFFTKPRLKVLEYLSCPSNAMVMFVFRQPSLSYQNNLFVLPFNPKVWLCIFGVVILMLFIIYMNARWESIKLGNNDSLDKTCLTPNTGEIAMMIIGAITQQGTYTEFKGTLGRIVMFLVLMLFVFLYTSYSANIVALLQSTSNEIKTLTDLLNSKMELGVEDTAYNRHFFSTATEPVRRAIYEKKIAPKGSKPNFMNLEDGVKKMQKEPFAFNMYGASGYRFVEKYFLEHEKCGLQEIQYLQENKPWLTCKKNSPFKEIYKIGLTRNHEHGLIDRVNRMIFTKKPPCIAHGGVFDSVTITDFYPALLILIYGMILAVVLMIVEILHFHRCRRLVPGTV